MDCGSVYIKMCDCPEIQGLRGKAPLGSWCGDGGIRYLWECSDVYAMFDCKIVFLPRQDQLQEMVGNDWDGFIGHYSYEDYDGDENPIGDIVSFPTESGEQLWLAFMMKKLWNKAWDGEKWA